MSQMNSVARYFFRAIAILSAAIFCWFARFRMGPDGVSYLDIGDAWWRGDFHHAANAYWSPLYSWILGLFLKVFRPSISWEFPLVQFVNFLIFIATLAAFDIFLGEALKHVRPQESKLSESWGRALGYTLFISTSIMMIDPSSATPDMLVACFFYLALAFALKAERSEQKRPFVALGIVLGLGYLAKTILFPVFAVLLAVLFVRSKHRKQLATATAVFVLIALPWIAICSHAKQRLTIGDSGRFVFMTHNDGVSGIYPEGGRTPLLVSSPATYDVSAIPATYSPWFDPTFWLGSLKPHLDINRLKANLVANLTAYCILVVHPVFHLSLLVAFIFAAISGANATLNRAAVILLVPSVAALAAYAPLNVEYRLVAPFFCVLWLILFLRMPMRPIFVLIPIIVLIPCSLIFLTQRIASSRRIESSDVPAAYLLREMGLKPGDRIALITSEADIANFAQSTFVPRLAKLQIVAENPDASFARVNAEGRNRALDAMQAIGAKTVLAPFKPCDDLTFKMLGKTGFYALDLRARPNIAAAHRLQSESQLKPSY